MGSSPMPLPEFTLPRTSVQVVEHDGARYRIFTAWPQEPAPPAGYPIVYLLDADAAFGTLVETIRMRSRRPDATGVPPSLVVGVSLVVDQAGDKARRTRDFTPRGLMPPAGEWPADATPETGGADIFLSFLVNDVRRMIEGAYDIDASRRTIVGHSLGGFFVLHALFSRPSSFATFVAASPSIWWDVAGVMARAGALAQSAAAPAPRVLLTAGEYEQALAPWQPVSALTDDVRARRDRRRMVDHVMDLAQRLAPLAGRGGAVDCVLMPGEDHASVVPLTISRAVRFGLGRIE